MTHKDFAIQIAKEAGKIIKDNFSMGMKKEWKTTTSPVTETDFTINRLLIEKVKEYFPKMGVMGEEESFGSKKNDLWLCDPVDGTIPFSHNVPICTFSLARVKNGKALLGVVYEPFTDRLFYAEKGKGAFMNGDKIHVNDAETIKSQTLDWEFWSRAPYYFTGMDDELDKDGAMIFRFCSLVYGAMLTATGEGVGAIFAGNTAHDVAALKVIIEEAGGKVTDLDGNDQKYNQNIKGAIISNGKVHNYLVDKVKKYFQKKE